MAPEDLFRDHFFKLRGQFLVTRYQYEGPVHKALAKRTGKSSKWTQVELVRRLALAVSRKYTYVIIKNKY